MDIKSVATKCRERRERLGLRQSDVAEQIGCSKENISSFECGRNNNAKILLWYIYHGVELEDLRHGAET